MPHGFFTVEEWKSPKRGAKAKWIAVCDLNAENSLTDVLAALEKRNEAGFFRVVQTRLSE